MFVLKNLVHPVKKSPFHKTPKLVILLTVPNGVGTLPTR